MASLHPFGSARTNQSQNGSVDLSHIQDQLHNNTDLRKKFLEDPVAFLEGEGMVIDPEIGPSLRTFAAPPSKPQSPPGHIPKPPKPAILISIRIPFLR